MLNKYKEIFICLVIIITTFSVYGQVTNFEFINYDDSVYVTDNHQVQAGLTLDSIKWAFTDSGTTGNWHPLTWISHMLDCQFFGINPGKHHLISVLFHIANTLLLFLAFHIMTGEVWQSTLIAVLFSLHPLHVESVAWISERKDVLSTFFALLTMLSYLWYVNQPEIKRYVLTLFLFVFGVMAKSMIITLPLVLLLIDYWPLGRFRIIKEPSEGNAPQKPSFSNTLIVEKIPFILIAAGIGLAAVFSQQTGRALAPLSQFPIDFRINNAIMSYATYIEKTIWPHNLAFFYPYQKTIAGWKIAGDLFFLGLISFISIKTIKRYPFFFVGWWWYIITLLPVIGLVQIGMHSRADRYTYIPLIGLFIIISWGISLFRAKRKVQKILLPSIVVLVSFVFVRIEPDIKK